MQRKLKNNAAIPGLIYTVGLAVFCIVLALIFFTEQRLSDYLFDIGVDSVGALISAALFFGIGQRDVSLVRFLKTVQKKAGVISGPFLCLIPSPFSDKGNVPLSGKKGLKTFW